MIFKPRLARLVLAGKKTQTRRPVKAGEETCRYHEGRSYAVQPGRGKPQVCRIKILEVRRELLHEITYPDAVAEGFRTRDEFFDYWRELYKTGPLIEVPVWAIRFCLDDDAPRLLAQRSEHGYTTEERLALAAERGAEAEAVPTQVLDRFARRNREREAEGWIEKRAELERILAELPKEAQAEVRVIRRRIEAIDRRLRSAA